MWEPPEDPNGNIREYRVNVTEEETGRMFQLITNTTNIIIGSLHSYYTYNCTVVVTIGPGPFSVSELQRMVCLIILKKTVLYTCKFT